MSDWEERRAIATADRIRKTRRANRDAQWAAEVRAEAAVLLARLKAEAPKPDHLALADARLAGWRERADARVGEAMGA